MHTSSLNGYNETSVETLTLNKKIQWILQDTDTTDNAKTFRSILQPADVIIVVTPPSRVAKRNSITGKLISTLLPRLQRSPFTSSKLVISQEKLMGYGLSEKQGTPLLPYSAKTYLNILHGGCLIRHKDMTEDKAKKIIDYFKEREGTLYANSHLWKTLLNRMTKERMFGLTDTGEIEKEQENIFEAIRPLICSTIIVAAYKYVGLDIESKFNNPFDLWPSDLLISESFKPIILLDKDGDLKKIAVK